MIRTISPLGSVSDDRPFEYSFVGIDGCRSGWIVIACGDRGFGYGLAETAQELLDLSLEAKLVFIDIPIGLSHDSASRDCDRQLRRFLSPGFSSSVFNPPIRAAVYANSYEEACQKNAEATGKKISKQSWNIAAKIRLMDELLAAHPQLTETVLESHPEFLFFNLNGGNLLKHKKKTREGRTERLQLLSKTRSNVEQMFNEVRSHFLKKQMADDDIVDALALSICARMASKNGIGSLPRSKPLDDKGIPMAIHFMVTLNS